MNKIRGEEAITGIYEYFRYKSMPSDSQMEKWIYKLRFIPDEAVPWICNEITELDRLPPNLPKEFKRQWYSYRKAHPEKVATEQAEMCEDCHGHGMHMFKKFDRRYDPPMKISHVAMCSKCSNWRKQWGDVSHDGGNMMIEGQPIGMPVEPSLKITRQEIEDRGWEYMPLKNPRERDIVIRKDKLDQLTDSIG